MHVGPLHRLKQTLQFLLRTNIYLRSLTTSLMLSHGTTNCHSVSANALKGEGRGERGGGHESGVPQGTRASLAVQ